MLRFSRLLFLKKYKLHVRHQQIHPDAKYTVVFLHGLGDTGDLWRPTINNLPSKVSAVSLDLLGFGNSPKPQKSRYLLEDQVASINYTLRKLKITKPYVMIGHSLGCLISIDYAKNYPRKIRRLILCSPPIYDYPKADIRSKLKELILKSTYEKAMEDPGKIIKLYKLARKINIVGPSIAVNPDTIRPFIITLRESILKQKTVEDIRDIDQPITLLNGRADPLTIDKTLRKIAKEPQDISYIAVNAAHAINSTYAKIVAKLIKRYDREDG